MNFLSYGDTKCNFAFSSKFLSQNNEIGVRVNDFKTLAREKVERKVKF